MQRCVHPGKCASIRAGTGNGQRAIWYHARMNRLFLVRHGLTEWNQGERYQGQIDVPLAAKGRCQAAALRDRLRNEHFDICYASALSRALETAETILEEHFCPLQQYAELNELSYGAWEGLTRAEIIARHPEDWERHILDPATYPPTGGESRAELRIRVVRTLETIDAANRDASILVVSHGGTIRMIIAHYLGIDDNHLRRLRIDNVSLSVVDVYPGWGMLSLFNDTAHLLPGKPPLSREPAS